MLETSARRRLALVAGSAIATLTLLLGGCSSDGPKAAAPSPTPISDLDTAGMKVPRIEFCPLVPAKAVTAALGGKVTARTTYGNGEEQELPGVGRDVVHELGCSWTGADGTTARAWVFASPVTPGFARTVVAAQRAASGCRIEPGSGFGEPASTQVCQLTDGRRRVRDSGLFGQTWLTCELTAAVAAGEQPTLGARTDQWCVEVVNAVDTAR